MSSFQVVSILIFVLAPCQAFFEFFFFCFPRCPGSVSLEHPLLYATLQVKQEGK